MGRIANAWAALLGRQFEPKLQPVELLNLDPDDQIFFECQGHIRADEREKIRNEIESWLSGESRRVVVLGYGIRLVAIRNTKKRGAYEPEKKHPRVFGGKSTAPHRA